MTQGAVPVHVYGDFDTVDGCYVPSNELSGFTIGEGSIITVSGNVPDTGLVYVTVHLDYGLKKTVGYWRDIDNNAHVGEVMVIEDLTGYEFSFAGSEGDTQTIENMNVFKKNPGFGGVVESTGGNPVSGILVEIYGPASPTTPIGTTTTDADGYYFYSYKHTGKEATFTVKLPDYSLDQSVTLKANKFAEANFTIP